MADNRNDRLGLAVMYGGSMTDTQAQQEITDTEAFMLAMGRGDTTKNVVVTGDSQTAFFYSKVTRRLEFQFLNQSIFFNPVGQSGDTIAQMTLDYATTVLPLYDATKTHNVLFVWATTNDIGLGTPIGTLQAQYQNYCSQAQSDGWLVIAVPTMARDFSSDVTKTLNIDLFDVWLSTNSATFSDGLVSFPSGNNYYNARANFANDADYITENQNITANMTNYLDGTHLTELVGYVDWGNVFANALTPLI